MDGVSEFTGMTLAQSDRDGKWLRCNQVCVTPAWPSTTQSYGQVILKLSCYVPTMSSLLGHHTVGVLYPPLSFTL